MNIQDIENNNNTIANNDSYNNTVMPISQTLDDQLFAIVILLRGNNTGRKLKRRILSIGLIKLTFGIIFLIITTQSLTFAHTDYYSNEIYGTSLMQLCWATCIPSLLSSPLCFYLIYQWRSIVTNRNLLCQLLYLLNILSLIILGLIIFCLIVLFSIFAVIPLSHWNSDPILISIHPLYISMIFFIFIYSFTLLVNILEVSTYKQEVAIGAFIDEIDIPLWYHPVKSLSNTTLYQFLFDLFLLPYYCCYSIICLRNTTVSSIQLNESKSKKKTINYYRMINKFFKRLFKKKKVKNESNVMYDLHELLDTKVNGNVLNHNEFNSKWETLELNGDFDCKLFMLPHIDEMIDHLQSQSFHIVSYQTFPNQDIQIDFCNIIPFTNTNTIDEANDINDNIHEEYWFLCKFSTNSEYLTFHADIKCEVPSKVPTHVKHFHLSKILNIDPNH